MKVTISTEFSGFAQVLADAGMSKRIINELKSAANKEAVLAWQRRILPGHFQGGGQNRYGMQRRKAPYRSIKQKLAQGKTLRIHGVRVRDKVKKGGLVKIVRSGRTEEMAKSPAPVASFPTRAVLSMRVPAYAARRSTGGKPNLPKEMTATTSSERDSMRRVWIVTFMRLLKRVRGKVRRGRK